MRITFNQKEQEGDLPKNPPWDKVEYKFDDTKIRYEDALRYMVDTYKHLNENK